MMVCYEPHPRQYKLLTVIGRSRSGLATISLAKHLPSGGSVAIRRLHLEKRDDSSGLDFLDTTEEENEFILSRQLDHPNVLRFYACFVSGDEIWEVMPLMAFGSCKDLVQAHFNDGLPEAAIAYVIRDVLQALEYIHRRGIIHRNVRASHVLVSAGGRVCLTGLTNCVDTMKDGARRRAVHVYPRNSAPAMNWLAPEVLEQNMLGYTTNSDIYSIGILACELANGRESFCDMQPTQMLLEKMYGTIPQLMDSTTLSYLIADANQTAAGETTTAAPPDDDSPYKRTFSNNFHHFVALCTTHDAKSRPTAAELLAHNFLKQVKRRSSLDLLPNLLYPVTPLGDVDNLPADDSFVDEQLRGVCESLRLNENWAFD
ncbi:STE20-related kinase adapter protein alpha-like [Tubulanus polymorphus]|uniref:STE20-related kinase adapter protein alpha-like n=1 Tax=Tubulanus polymorphus TaxID=672921 RepID=UPI003DA570CE